MKDKIRHIYSELQGCLSQTPSIKNNYDSIDQRAFWEHINSTIDELSTILEKDYSSYKLVPSNREENYIRVSVVRLKLGAIISRLHGEYYSDEPAPFSGMPSVVNNFSQSQQQTATQTIVLEFQELLSQKIASIADEEEKTFLQKIKEGLGTVRNTAELIKLILELGIKMNFDVKHILTLLS